MCLSPCPAGLIYLGCLCEINGDARNTFDLTVGYFSSAPSSPAIQHIQRVHHNQDLNGANGVEHVRIVAGSRTKTSVLMLA